MIKKKEKQKELTYDRKDLKFNLDLSQAHYEIDPLQEKIIFDYQRRDERFKRAFNTNYTNDFLAVLKKKCELKEPITISIMGWTRGGKSSVGITIGVIIMAFHGRCFNIDFICANEIDFLKKIKEMDFKTSSNSVFLIDEQKSFFGVGSTAKKIKLTDVQNIIAKHNISTVSICPTRFANEDAQYGLRVLGRCFKTRTVRLMLYDLQESKMGTRPLGMIYLPIYDNFLPQEFAEKLKKDYLKIKDEWIEKEVMNENDVMGELKLDTAKMFIGDKEYDKLKTKDEKITYISMVLGAEWTVGEKKEVFTLTEMLKRGIKIK